MHKIDICLYNNNHNIYINPNTNINMTNHVIFVTGNKTKQTEISNIFFQEFIKNNTISNIQLHFYNLKTIIPEIQSINTMEVAIHKASEASKIILMDTEYIKQFKSYNNIYVLVDDTGLYSKTSPINKITYDGLGYPGALIKQFTDNIDGNSCNAICNAFGGSIANVQVSIGIYNLKQNITSVVNGKIIGYIPVFPQYDKDGNGFGFDPCFIPNIMSETGDMILGNKSYAEMSQSEKNQISARKIAIINAIKQIQISLTS